MLPSQLIPAVERALAFVSGERVRLTVSWIAPNTVASHVFRVAKIGPGGDLPGSLIVKAANLEFLGDSREMLLTECAALQYLEDIGCVPAVSARLYTSVADAAIPFLVMEDLCCGSGSPYEIVERNNPEAAEEALLEYARALGRLHSCGSARRGRFLELRAKLPLPQKRRPLFHDPWSSASSYAPEEVRQATTEYRAVLSALGVPTQVGLDDEIEHVTRVVEEHTGAFLTLCQGDQNTMRQCIRQGGEHRMIDFGVAGLRHALIEGIPHRITWGCVNRIPRRLFTRLEEAYRNELVTGCVAAKDKSRFWQAMIEAAARWSIFHIIWRVPDALRADRPRGAATLRQQVLAWLSASS